jgi:hypothetical protein
VWWSVGALNLWGDPSRGAEKRAVDGRWAAVYLLFGLVTNSSRPLASQATTGGLGGTRLVAGVPLVVARQGRRERPYLRYGRDRGRRIAAIQRSPGGTEFVSPSPPTTYGTMRRTVAVLETFRAGWRALVASASEP